MNKYVKQVTSKDGKTSRFVNQEVIIAVMRTLIDLKLYDEIDRVVNTWEEGEAEVQKYRVENIDKSEDFA